MPITRTQSKKVAIQLALALKEEAPKLLLKAAEPAAKRAKRESATTTGRGKAPTEAVKKAKKELLGRRSARNFAKDLAAAKLKVKPPSAEVVCYGDDRCIKRGNQRASTLKCGGCRRKFHASCLRDQRMISKVKPGEFEEIFCGGPKLQPGEDVGACWAEPLP